MCESILLSGGWVETKLFLRKECGEKHKLSTQRLLLHHTVLEALVYRVVKELMANLLIFRHLPMIRS